MSSCSTALFLFPIPYYCSPYCFTTTFKSWTTGGMPSNVGTRSVTVAALDADVKILTATREGLGAVPVKGMFEAVTAVLVLVRV